jgi:orotate phosphoribosyltransferase
MADHAATFPTAPPGASPGSLDLRRLTAMLAERSARRGQFTLSSGRSSTLYVDARKTTMSPDGLALIGPLGLAAVRGAGWAPDAVGGLTLGADPVAYAIAYASALAAGADGPPAVRAFTVRKAAKAHGTGQRIEGPFRAGDRVVVVEDVITTGGSALQAIEAVREAGAVVAGVLAVVDREEGGREAITGGAGVPVLALARAAEVLALLPPGAEDGGAGGA